MKHKDSKLYRTEEVIPIEINRVKPLAELTAADIPRGLRMEDLALQELPDGVAEDLFARQLPDALSNQVLGEVTFRRMVIKALLRIWDELQARRTP